MGRSVKKEPKLRSGCDKSKSSLDIKSNQADQEADDEYSDRPAYDKVSHADQEDNSSTDVELTDDMAVQFKIVPWWENTSTSEAGFLSAAERKSSYTEACLKKSNYQLVNQNESEEKVKEFDEILNGALGLMSPVARNSFQSRINKSSVCWNIYVIQNQIFTACKKE